MKEGDAPAARTAPRDGVDQAVASRPAALQRPIEFGHAVAEMVDPGPALGEKPRHRALWILRLEELDPDAAQAERNDRRAVGGLGSGWLEAEHVPVERKRGGDVGQGDAYVSETGAGVDHVARQHNDCERRSAGPWQMHIPW